VGVYEDGGYSTADNFKLVPARAFEGHEYQIKAYALTSYSGIHVVNAAGVIRNNAPDPQLMGGAASGADPIYIYDGFPLNISYFIPPAEVDNPVPVISVSQDQPAFPENYSFSKDYARADRAALDYPYPLYVFGAGNDGNDRFVGNLPRNGLVVGEANHQESPGRSDDVVSPGSQGRNPLADNATLPNGDAEFPHLVAATPAYAAYDRGTWGGTSAAAPMVAAAALRIMQANNELRWWPEASRAILMASADHTIGSARVTGDAIDDLGGAGELDAAAAVDLAFPVNLVYPTIDRPGESPREVAGKQKGYWFGHHCDTSVKRWYVQSDTPGILRAVAAFDAVPYPPACGSGASSSECGMRVAVDSDLIVDRKGGPFGWTPVQASASWDDTTEFIQVSLEPNQKYRITVTNSPGGAESCTYMGVAFRIGGD
jgi:hypothetical protein